MARKRKILVTGATGFIGGAVSRRLVLEGYKVFGLARHMNSELALSLKQAGIDLIKGDISDSESCNKALEGISAVVNCAGILGGWGREESLFWKVNYEGTKNLIEASMIEHVSHFIHISSCGILGPQKRGCIATDEAAHNPINVYERTKSEAEKLALLYSAKGAPVSVVRPEFVYGPGDLHLLPLFKNVAEGRFAFFGDGLSTLHPTYIDDVVDAVLLTLWNPKTIGLAMNIAGERPVTVKEFITDISKSLGVKTPRMHVPLKFALGAGLILDNTIGLVSKPPLTHSQVKYLSECRAFSCALARNVIGYTPKISLGEGMGRTVRWYRERALL